MSTLQSKKIKKNTQKNNFNVYNTTKDERMKYYNQRRWWSLRKTKLINSPLCERCLEMDRINPAIDIHHKDSPFKYTDEIKRNELFFEYDNLESLCKECHGKHHRKEQLKEDKKEYYNQLLNELL